MLPPAVTNYYLLLIDRKLREKRNRPTAERAERARNGPNWRPSIKNHRLRAVCSVLCFWWCYNCQQARFSPFGRIRIEYTEQDGSRFWWNEVRITRGSKFFSRCGCGECLRNIVFYRQNFPFCRPTIYYFGRSSIFVYLFHRINGLNGKERNGKITHWKQEEERKGDLNAFAPKCLQHNKATLYVFHCRMFGFWHWRCIYAIIFRASKQRCVLQKVSAWNFDCACELPCARSHAQTVGSPHSWIMLIFNLISNFPVVYGIGVYQKWCNPQKHNNLLHILPRINKFITRSQFNQWRWEHILYSYIPYTRTLVSHTQTRSSPSSFYFAYEKKLKWNYANGIGQRGRSGKNPPQFRAEWHRQPHKGHNT